MKVSPAQETVIDALMLAQCYTDTLAAMMHVTSANPNVEVTNKPSVPPAQPRGYEPVALLPVFFQVQAQLSVTSIRDVQIT